MKLRVDLFFKKAFRPKASPPAMLPSIPNSINFGRFTGSIEFQGETKSETEMDAPITYQLNK